MANIDLGDNVYDLGYQHGYDGEMPTGASEQYLAGYRAGSQQWDDEVRADREAQMDDEAQQDVWADAQYEWDAVSQGMYDDDPSPYDGTYSEM